MTSPQPSSFFAAFQRAQQSENILKTIMSFAVPSTRRFLTPEVLARDILPHLLELLCPRIRPMALALLSAAEKKSLAGVVDTMLAYNISLAQVRFRRFLSLKKKSMVDGEMGGIAPALVLALAVLASFFLLSSA